MKRGGPLRRTPLAKGGPPTRRSSLPRNRKPMSRKPSRRVQARDLDWPAARTGAFDRAGGRCERCGRPVVLHPGDQHRPDAMHGHHRRKRSQGGRNGLENIACLCSGCHGWVHANETTARELGWIVASTRWPAVTAVTLHDGRTVLLTTTGGYDVVPFDKAAS